MAMTDDEIRGALSKLLVSGNRSKDKVMTWFVLAGAVLGLVAGALAYGFFDETLGLWGIASFVIAVVIGFLVLGLFGTLGDLLVNRRLAEIADRFRKTFTQESGDYVRAVQILKSAKTSEKVEIDLLEPDASRRHGSGHCRI